MGRAFGVVSIGSSLNPRLPAFPSVFPCRSFIVLHFIFSPVIHVKLLCIKGVRLPGHRGCGSPNWLGVSPHSGTSPGCFAARAHASVAGSAGAKGGRSVFRTSVFLSLSFSLPRSLKSCKVCVWIHFLHADVRFLQHHLLKRLSFLPEPLSLLRRRPVYCLCVGVFLGYSSVDLLGFFFYPHPKTFFHCFLEREEGRKRSIDVREKHLSVAFSYTPRPGTKPTTSVCVPTRNRTRNPLVMGWHAS